MYDIMWSVVRFANNLEATGRKFLWLTHPWLSFPLERVSMDIMDFGPSIPGYPDDNGVQFISNLFQELAKLMHATNHYTIRYHPQANGMIERTNRVVKSALTTLVNDRPRTWLQFVPELRLQINSAIHRTTGEQPLYMLTGRHANFQIGLTNEAVFDENINLQARLREARQAAVKPSREARQIYGKAVRQRQEGGIPAN
ncbi:uncharacterized protein LOC125048329 [Penaeus chinensis]|uniref:uncharacterized protein LOC125048329 n=1 Tax=Penaeus chinensis TaxID=139456 RepID=UPI001FB60BAA|nr:uncharacterized protein LOC125048329 [Penaeus chinensis]